MKCITLIIVAMALLALASAGKVTIKGACVDCNKPTTEAETTPARRQSGRHTTPKPKAPAQRAPAASKDSDADDADDDWSALSQGWGGLGGGGGRHKRQYYNSGGRVVIPEGFSGRVPGGTYVHNSDCRNCNINADADY